MIMKSLQGMQTLACGACEKIYNVTHLKSGTRFRCKGCKDILKVPSRSKTESFVLEEEKKSSGVSSDKQVTNETSKSPQEKNRIPEKAVRKNTAPKLILRKSEENGLILKLKGQIRQEQENGQDLLDEIISSKNQLLVIEEKFDKEELISSSLRDKIERLEKSIERKEERINSQDEVITKDEVEIRGLKQSNQQFEKITDEQGKTITDLRQREDHLQQEISDKREHTQRLGNIIEDREEQIKNQGDEIKNLRSVYVTQEDSIHKLRTAEETLSRKIVSQTNLQAKLEKLISSKNNEILELSAQLERSNEKYLHEKKQGENAQRGIASLKAKLDELHEVLSENASEIRERDKKISALVKLVEEGRLEIQKERDENRVRLMIQSLVSKREELDAQIEQLTKIQDCNITPEMLKPKAKVQTATSTSQAPPAKKIAPTLRKRNNLPVSRLEPDSEERNYVDEQFPSGTAVELDGRNGKVLSDGLIQFDDGGIANLQAVHQSLNVASQIIEEG